MKLVPPTLIILLSLVPTISFATWVSVWGTAQIGNSTAPAGVVVGVYNSTTLLLERETISNENGTFYILDFQVPANSSVYFKIAGVNAIQSLQSVGNGGSINLNLSIIPLNDGEKCEYDTACSSGNCLSGICAPAGTTTTTVSGGGGAGGGSTGGGPAPIVSGGGGGVAKTTTTSTTTTTIKSAATTTLMVQATTTTAPSTTTISTPSATIQERQTGGLITGFAAAIIKEPLTFIALVLVIAIIIILALRILKAMKKK